MATASELSTTQHGAESRTKDIHISPTSAVQQKDPPEKPSGQDKSLDLFITHVLRINQFLRESCVYQQTNPDEDSALSQLDVYAFLVDMCLRLITKAKSGHCSQNAWFLLEEILKVVDQGSAKDLQLSSSLRHVFTGWCRFMGTQSQPDNSGDSGSIGVTPNSPRKRGHAVGDSQPMKYQSMATSDGEDESEDSEVEDSDVEVSNDSGQSSYRQSNLAEKKQIQITYTDHMRVKNLVQGSSVQVIVDKFKLRINRGDLCSLYGSNWLNDNVINFYMELLNERAEQSGAQLPSVYAMSTFFLPRLLGTGYAAVRRWTRKIDLFSKQIIPVPVHSSGMPKHWSMAIIHMRDKAIRYYDSLGKSNQRVLQALEAYLQQESLDKRRQPFDTSGFKLESVQDVPRQLNGDDCGVFSCTFAEYITRDAPITFTQGDMAAFRQKMILEIADGQLWPTSDA